MQHHLGNAFMWKPNTSLSQLVPLLEASTWRRYLVPKVGAILAMQANGTDLVAVNTQIELGVRGIDFNPNNTAQCLDTSKCELQL